MPPRLLPASMTCLALAFAATALSADQVCRVQNTSGLPWSVWMSSNTKGTVEVSYVSNGRSIATLTKRGDKFDIVSGDKGVMEFRFKGTIVAEEIGLKTESKGGAAGAASTYIKVRSGAKPETGPSPRAVYTMDAFDNPKNSGIFLQLK